LPFLGHEFQLLNLLANPPNTSAGKAAEWGSQLQRARGHQVPARDGYRMEEQRRILAVGGKQQKAA